MKKEIITTSDVFDAKDKNNILSVKRKNGKPISMKDLTKITLKLRKFRDDTGYVFTGTLYI